MLSEVTRILVGLCLLEVVHSVCPLCATPADLPKRWTYKLPSGLTCQELYLELGRINNPNDPSCIAAKVQSEELCCGDEEPDPVVFPPTAPPVYNGPVGNEPDCHVCGTEEYPGIPTAFVVARYVGDYTCDQLYFRGRNGLIPNFMCGPLQDFTESVCGCGTFNPACKQDVTKCFDPPSSPPQPVPTEVQAPVQAPVPSPTAPPPQPPIPSPTAPPAQPQVTVPTLFERKIPRRNGKLNSRMSGGSGGSAGRLRGNRELHDEENSIIPELN
jgi:hypothetical protein